MERDPGEGPRIGQREPVTESGERRSPTEHTAQPGTEVTFSSTTEHEQSAAEPESVDPPVAQEAPPESLAEGAELVSLSINNPIRTKSVQSVERVGEKLVFVLADNAEARLVVKFETPVRESVKQIGERQELIQELARRVLDNVPEVQRLSEEELTVLGGLTVPGSENLNQLLEKEELGTASLALKIEHVDVGQSLLDMVNRGQVDNRLLSDRNVHSLGKMALFDLLVGNYDRFTAPVEDEHQGAEAHHRYYYGSMENIDFRLTDNRYEVVSLDNLAPDDQLRSTGLDAFFNEGDGRFIANADARRRYAADVTVWLIDRLGLQPAIREVGNLQASFSKGMEDALSEIRKWAMSPLMATRAARHSDVRRALTNRVLQIED
jgi:hypothetical protein